ncbi:MAG: 5'-nucleotidase C-terminal domain-containing protein, partial [Nevskia sp.]|nr:5'-nucleotidase C-terminal domain-containing protein [Nevskia sp.]
GTPRIVKHDGIAGLRFDDEAATVNALVPRLKAGGADAIVVLIHQGGATGGWYDDQACPNLGGEIVPIVNALDPAVDVVVSGHTHTAYANCYLTAADGRKRILVTQAGSYGHFVSAIDIRFDTASHAIAGIDAHNLPVVNAAPADPSLAALYPALPADAAQAQRVARYDRLAAPVAGRTVGTLGADLLRAEDAAGESALGDVVADAQLAATAPAKSGGAVAALAHPGGIRGDLAAGTVTYGALYNVQPFGDALVVMSLSGAQLKQVLEEQWSGRRPTMLQVSTGMHYAWDATRPAGDRVTAISIGGAAVDMADTAPRYRIEVNDYIAEGGDGFTALAGGTQRVVGPRDIDALAGYLAAHANLAAPAAGRISCSGC